MAKRRRFTPEFKAEVVIEALSGDSSQAELCRKPHNLSADQLSKWKQQLLENAETPLFESTDKQSDASIERIAEKLEFHYTPKHGSWLNIAEIEFSVLRRKPCLSRRIPDQETLKREVQAWQNRRNQQGTTVH